MTQLKKDGRNQRLIVIEDFVKKFALQMFF